MAWLIANWQLVVAILVSIVSEVIAIRQMLKFPDNDGVGGILAGILKFLSALKPQA